MKRAGGKGVMAELLEDDNGNAVLQGLYLNIFRKTTAETEELVCFLI